MKIDSNIHVYTNVDTIVRRKKEQNDEEDMMVSKFGQFQKTMFELHKAQHKVVEEVKMEHNKIDIKV